MVVLNKKLCYYLYGSGKVMEKSNKICLAIILACTLLVVGLCVFAIINHKDVKLSDAAKFKEEYESLNGLVNESTEEEYLTVEIDIDNPMVYKSGQQIIDIMKNEDAIIYFGFSSCPWCRNAISVLLDAAKDLNVKTIYYVDILNIRDTYKFSGSIQPEQTKKGTDAYYEILDILDSKLEKFYVTDESGNMYDTGVKRLYAPTVVAISKGKVKGFHVATVESQKDPYIKLTDKEKEELEKTYKEIINSLEKNKVCKDEKAC